MERVAIIGAGGRLGRALCRAYDQVFEVIAFDRSQLDLFSPAQIEQRVRSLKFDLLVNCAALTNVDYCETHREEAFQINVEAPRLLARLAHDKSAKIVHFSTDYVFDGTQSNPYTEEDEARPISVYGESKLAGEHYVMEESNRSLVVRISWVFGPDRPSFIDQVIQRARQSTEVAAVADKFSTPTYTLDVTQWLRLAWETTGYLHLANDGLCSWWEYAQHALDCGKAAGILLQAEQVEPLKLKEMTNFIARRPVYSVLSTEKFARLTGVKPRSWREAVAEYVTLSKNENAQN
jgi:dTDP-4-dehydrorhamnose reductase